MATILTAKDLESFKLIVSASGKGRTGRFHYLSDMIRGMSVGDFIDISDDLTSEETDIVSRFVSQNGNVSADERAAMRSVVSAFVRETRKIHGKTADIVGQYFGDDDSAHYVVKRTA